MHQQRAVITTAIILAFVLSGALWYSLSQPFIGAEPTPTPSPIGDEASATPSQFTFPDAAGTPLADAIPTPVAPPTTVPVTPAAPTGPAEYVLALSGLTLVMGALGLRRTISSLRQ